MYIHEYAYINVYMCKEINVYVYTYVYIHIFEYLCSCPDMYKYIWI